MCVQSAFMLNSSLTGCYACMRIRDLLQLLQHGIQDVSVTFAHKTKGEVQLCHCSWIGMRQAIISAYTCHHLCLHVQDDFFEEALGLHKDIDEDSEGAQAQSESQRVMGKSKEKSRKLAKGRGMGNKANLRR